MHCDRQLYGTATVNDKGQVVIPAEARKALGIEADDRFVVVADKKRKVLALVPAELMERKMQSFFGRMFFGDPDPTSDSPTPR